MRVLRLFFYGIPAALLILLAAAFVNASFLSVAKKNEMSIGTLGEPSTLNPIQQADSASSQVGGLIFNGLIKYNQHLEIVGDLASNWELSQETTFQFATEQEASNAAEFVMSNLALITPKDHPIITNTQNPNYKASDSQTFILPNLPILKISRKGNRLVILLREPGMEQSKLIAKALENFHPLPFPALEPGGKERPFTAEPIIRFTLRDGVRWHDGAPFTSADVAFTYRAIMNEKVASPRRSDFDLVDSVETPDPRSVIVRYKKPFSPPCSVG